MNELNNEPVFVRITPFCFNQFPELSIELFFDEIYS